MSDLDTLIERARSATVHRASAERYVRELDHRAQESSRPRRWVPWLAAGLAAAAAIGVVLWWWESRDQRVARQERDRGSSTAIAALIPLSERVAIVADPDTVYRVERPGSDRTRVTIERGVVTARLWPGARAHHLELSGGDITAIATGTVYSLAVRPSGAVVSVLEGTVEVRTAKEVHAVHASQSWPPGSTAVDPAAGRALLALSAPPALSVMAEAAPAVDAGIALDAGDAPEVVDADAPGDADAAPDPDAGKSVHRIERTTHPASPPPEIKDRWRTARLLRGQGQFARAVTECLAITDARDPTWSPIALVEAVRIELGPLADPERAIALADRMIREWPADALVPEARELRCRALQQLGRSGECAPAPQP